MDNLSIYHNRSEVGQLISQDSACVLYLLPYSPNLNTIEKLWSKIKSYLRKYRYLAFDALDKTMQEVFFKVVPLDCQNRFVSLGYY